MANQDLFEAGIFGLTPQGWIILDRRLYPAKDSAMQWVQRRTGRLARENPSARYRGSIVPVQSWLTLERVLADYEAKRLAGEPEFCDGRLPAHSTASAARGAAYTQRQGQYLAFIHYYTKLNGRPPAESDMQRYFQVSLPSVHQMLATLEQNGFIERSPGVARSIRLLLPREQLPDLQ